MTYKQKAQGIVEYALLLAFAVGLGLVVLGELGILGKGGIAGSLKHIYIKILDVITRF